MMLQVRLLAIYDAEGLLVAEAPLIVHDRNAARVALSRAILASVPVLGVSIVGGTLALLNDDAPTADFTLIAVSVKETHED